MSELSAAIAQAPTTTAIHRIAVDGLERDDTAAIARIAMEMQLAQRIATVTAGRAIAARFAPGSFAVLQRDIYDVAEVRALAEHLLADVGRELSAGTQTMPVPPVRIGYALSDGRTTHSERVLAHAEIALEHATDAERIVAFVPSMSPSEQARRELEQRVREATDADGFELMFQPVRTLADRRLTGFEAVPMLTSGGGPALEAAAFMPAAEALGLGDMINARLLQAACRAAMSWPDHLVLTWSASPTSALGETVARAIADTGLPAARLRIAVTEDLLFDEPTRAIGELERLRALGVMITLADFGSGHASLSLLWRFRFDTLRIAATLLARLGADEPDSGREIRSLAALAHNLGMTLSAEAVASEPEAALLREAGCAEAQGPLLGPSLPPTEVAAAILGDFRARNTPAISAAENKTIAPAATG
jgi:EAL domain-containing protein (putative c-di-GMP-specific phosphodiesterase class I)